MAVTRAKPRQRNAVPPAKAEMPWREGLYDVLKEIGIRQVVYVPDAGHATLIDRCHADPEIKAGSLTNEFDGVGVCAGAWLGGEKRSEEHTSELQSLMRISYAVFCLKKKK